MTERLKNKFNDEELKIRANSDEKITVKLTNNYAFQKIFKNTKIVKGFLMALLDLKEYEIKKLKLQIHLHLEKTMKKKKAFLISN
nr:hypothetical protein [uncultured Anaerostipes sp.]